MVQLSLVKTSNASLVASRPLVAVFVGGTSNIGAHTIKSLAATHGENGKGLRAYIVGRNDKAAGDVISECQESCPKGKFRFIKVHDIGLMKEVDSVCAELIRVEEREAAVVGETARIDILIQTQANFKPWDPRLETTEGLDTFMSLVYYSRMRFINKLLPLLLASQLPARVISVYGPGRDTNFIPDDLSLRSPKNYSFWNAGCHAAYFTTFFLEHLAAQHPGKLALTHYYPGLILSDSFVDPSHPWWFRAIFRYGRPLISLFPMTLTGEESGARTLFNASPRFPPKAVDGESADMKNAGSIGIAKSSDGILGGGAYRVNYNDEQVATGKQYEQMRKDGWLEKCVQHTLKAWEVIEAGEVFTD